MTPAHLSIEKLSPNDPIPYGLLLLADETVESINKYLPGSEIYVANLPGEQLAVAAMVLKRLNDDEIEIKNIAVSEHLQSKGIGKAMIDKAVEIAQLNHCPSLLVGTGDCGVRQIAFYKKNGFEMYGIRKNFFIDNFPEPIYENGEMLKDMVILKREIELPHR